VLGGKLGKDARDFGVLELVAVVGAVSALGCEGLKGWRHARRILRPTRDGPSL